MIKWLTSPCVFLFGNLNLLKLFLSTGFIYYSPFMPSFALLKDTWPVAVQQKWPDCSQIITIPIHCHSPMWFKLEYWTALHWLTTVDLWYVLHWFIITNWHSVKISVCLYLHFISYSLSDYLCSLEILHLNMILWSWFFI